MMTVSTHFENSGHTLITCSAVALSRVLSTALVAYGKMDNSTPYSSETSQVIAIKRCMFDFVCEMITCAKFGCIPPARSRSTLTWNIHFLWLFFLPFFFCTPAQAKRIEIISRTMAQKTQFCVRKYPPSKCFSLIWRFGGHFPKTPHNFAPPVGKSQPN